MSNSTALLLELQQLRADLTVLSGRVLALESRLEGLDTSSSPPTGLTVNYVGTGYTVPAVAASSTSAEPVVDSLLSAERREVAEDIGRWLRRRLDGYRTGESGRSRIKLQSRVYVVVRGHSGQLFDPGKVFSTVSAFQHLVKAEDQTTSDESVFVGLPSIREAKIAVETAGLRYPADGGSR